jgi:putative transposase
LRVFLVILFKLGGLVRKKRYTEEQIFQILKEGESGLQVTDLCRKYGVSEATYFRWKSKYSGMELSDLKKMKSMEAENARLKRLVADQALQIDAMKEVLQKKW